MSKENTVSELELQAYLDGELAPERHAEIEAYLNDHPETAAALIQIKTVHNSLHKHYDSVLDQPIPESMTAHLTALNNPENNRNFSFSPQGYPRSIAANWLLLGCLLGTVFGTWLANTEGAKSSLPELAQNKQPPADIADNIHNDLIQPATFAHVIFAPERQNAVAINAGHQKQLAARLSHRMHWPIRIPDLEKQGLRLVGGQLLPSTNRMAAQFMYETENSQRMTLYIRRINLESDSIHFHFEEKNGLSVFYWLSSPLGYALTGQMDHATMLKVVEAIHKQLT